MTPGLACGLLLTSQLNQYVVITGQDKHLMKVVMGFSIAIKISASSIKKGI